MTQPARSRKAETAGSHDHGECAEQLHEPVSPVAAPVPLASLAHGPDAGPRPGALSAQQQLGRLRRQAESSVLRRAPVPTPVDGEFTDVNAPGFTFLSTGQPGKFRIKDSNVKLDHHADTDQWTNSQGLVVQFEAAPPRTLPEKGAKTLQHYTMRKFNQLSPPEQMAQISYLAADFGLTDYEREMLLNDPDEEIIELYRYHKFRADSEADALVFGGGVNKTEITGKVTNVNKETGATKVVDWQETGILKLLKVRHDSLAKLRQPGEGGAKTATRAMEVFQANAMTTPFIATTRDKAYALSLFKEYPPEGSQRAVILVIRGPRANTFDFEEEFRKMRLQGSGGLAELNNRIDPKRKEDNQQAEYGLADVFLPAQGKSQFGFWVEEVIELGVPTVEQASVIGSHSGTDVVYSSGLASSTPASKEGREGKEEA